MLQAHFCVQIFSALGTHVVSLLFRDLGVPFASQLFLHMGDSFVAALLAGLGADFCAGLFRTLGRCFVGCLLENLGHRWSAALFTKLGTGFVSDLFRQLGGIFSVALLSRHPAFSLQLSAEMGATFILGVSTTFCCALHPCACFTQVEVKRMRKALFRFTSLCVEPCSGLRETLAISCNMQHSTWFKLLKDLKCDLMMWRGGSL